MQLRDWVQERFGTTDTATLLDESAYSTNQLRTDKKKLEQSLKQLENDMDTHSQTYQKLLEEGAEADEMRRRQYAQKAKFEKKKYEIKKKKHKANSIKLGTIISIEGMREVMDMQESQELGIDEVMDEEVNAREVQSQIMDQMAQFGLELEDMQEVQDALDVEILDEDLEEGASEELEAMEQMAAGDISREQIDVEQEVEVETEEISVGAGIDDDLEEPDVL
jgi:hypothetical protein